MSKIDFLRPDTEQIRHQICGIIDSYSHDWDLLSELAQNAVDAIRQAAPDKGRVRVLVDASTQRISIGDNGAGIDPAQIEKLLRPFGTDKVGKTHQIGEKGVGLKFVIFSSSHFRLTTSGSQGGCTATIEDAASWSQSNNETSLSLDLEVSAQSHAGTTIEVRLANPSHRIFDFSFQDLVFLLRTKTALGNTDWVWNFPFEAETEFIHIDKGGQESRIFFDCKYLLPTEAVKQSDTENLDTFREWLQEQDRSDQEKRKKLLNKIVWSSGKMQKSGREIRYWSCFVPRREYWNILSKNAGVKDSSEGGELPSEETPGVGFTGGLQTSSKGMPTGISLELKPRGSAGYVPNFFMLIDDPSLKFDIGRKAVHGRQQGMLREIAYESFREYINITRKYMGGDIDPDLAEWDRDEVFEEVEGLPNLSSTVSRFVKRPNSQEATVAAMFFELLGRGEFSEIKPLISGYKDRYDLYAKWKARRIVMEFKYDLSGLFRDFNEERKMFNEITTVVVWEVTEADRILAKRRSVTIDPIVPSSLVEYQGFPKATKRLTLGDVTPIYVVELKPLIEAGSGT